jgi:hypothetical protein
MDLVFIYGPPASGKLTVAKELQKITKYKLFHNHLSFDLVHAIFAVGEGPFWELSGKIRMQVLEEAAKYGIKGAIMTFVYAKDADDKTMRKYRRRLEKVGVRMHFVQLSCNKEELFKRVRHPSRRAFKKIHRVKTLREAMRKHDLVSEYPKSNSLQINNTNISPRKAAIMIKRHFKL